MITTTIVPLRWDDGRLIILDQRRLPREEQYLSCATVDEIADAIRTLAVRGAPLIGITAAYGMVVAAREAVNRDALAALRDVLAGTRPTAVNLFWALERCWNAVCALPQRCTMVEIAATLLREAMAIHQEDAASCLAMAEAGVPCFSENARVLTHCNTGALATGGIGTALGVIRAAYAAGRVGHVWVDETRPLLQGARLTAWELEHDNIPHQLICDNMAASLMAAGKVDLVIVGADRITRTGDFANKIGTYGLAVLAHAHQIPFYVAAPWSTIDTALDNGTLIPVEQRSPDEVRCCGSIPITTDQTPVWNPSFDVTPAHLVRGFITERGVLLPPLMTVSPHE